MRTITYADYLECLKIKKPEDQQIFLLSCYYKVPKEELMSKPLHEILPMLEEMNNYFNGKYSTSIGDREGFCDSIDEEKQKIDKLENRFGIMDFSEKENGA